MTIRTPDLESLQEALIQLKSLWYKRYMRRELVTDISSVWLLIYWDRTTLETRPKSKTVILNTEIRHTFWMWLKEPGIKSKSNRVKCKIDAVIQLIDYYK